MSVQPVMESSSMEMRKDADLDSAYLRRETLSRQGSLGLSQDDMVSGSNPNRMTQSRLVSGLPLEQGEGVVKKSRVRLIVQNLCFQIFITVLTMISLILYDLKTIVLSKEEDFTIGVINSIFLFIFLMEILMNMSVKGYFCSFFFWLDFIATATLIMDIDFVTQAMFSSSSGSFDVSDIIEKSKASRAAARAVRVIKIFRLTRVAKLYKAAQKARELNESNQKLIREREKLRIRKEESRIETLHIQDHPTQNIFKTRHQVDPIARYDIQGDSIKQIQDEKINTSKGLARNKPDDKNIESSKRNQEQAPQQDLQSKESQISKILSQDSIKKIVIIILLIMMSIPLMDLSNYQDISTQWDYMIKVVESMLYDPRISAESINQILLTHSQNLKASEAYEDLLCIDTPFNELMSCSSLDFDFLRSSDLGVFDIELDVSRVLANRTDLTQKTEHLSERTANKLSVYLNYQTYNQIDAGFSIITTIFICLTIIYLLASFNNNISQLIITPIEKMLALIKSRSSAQEALRVENEESCEEYETQLVQQAIIKIRMMMENIFGHIGNDLIQEKMLSQKSIESSLQNSSKRSYTAMALCKIQHIDKIIEVLGQDAFGLINEISAVLEKAVFRYGGFCAKVQHDGFLLVFKVPEEQCLANQIEEFMPPLNITNIRVAPSENTYISILSDFALYAQLKMLVRLHKEPKIFKYKNDQRLLMAFGGSFNIEMNFALNMGWSQEAVVGSSFKIDPVFLGERVNQLQKLHRIIANHHNFIILSDSLYQNLTGEMRGYCRCFDCIKFPGMESAERVYMVDLDVSNVSPSRSHVDKYKKKPKLDIASKKEMNMVYLLNPNDMVKYNAREFVNSKKELREILKGWMSEDVRKKYQMLFEKYIKGDWSDCHDLLENEKLKSDLASQRIYEFMRKSHFRSSIEWCGYRHYQSLFD